MDKKQVKTVLTGDFSGIDNFIENIIYPIFGEECFEKKDAPEQLVTSESKAAADIANVSSILNVGTISNIKSEDIELFDVTLKNTSDISRSRVGIQRLIRSALSQYSHAFIVFHYKDCENKEWRFSYLHKEGTLKNTTSAKRYTYVFGNEHNPRTATERFEILANSKKTDDDLTNAFSVEALSLEFFSKYEEQYNKFVNYLIVTPAMQRSFKNILKKSDDTADDRETIEIYKTKYKPLRDYVKKMMGRLVFMYFLERKGWLAANKTYMKELFQKSSEDVKSDFLDKVLEPLFFGVLNTAKSMRKKVFDENGWDIRKVPNAMELPYLNGGLFEQDELDKCESKFPKEYFDELFHFFSEYNFTVDENDPNDEEMGIDPEMLSIIFESLLEDNKGKGAFYTRKQIVKRMCQEALITFLVNKTGINEKIIRNFIENTDEENLPDEIEKNKASIIKYLQNIKVCDPAIGSGAFPMGMLNLLVKVRLALTPLKNKNSDEVVELKKKIIQNNIYGVDIEKGAIDIARLRFWLSIVVDSKCTGDEIQPLPNFDYKFIQGNSLVPTFDGHYVNLDVGNNKVAEGSRLSAGSIVKRNLRTLQDLRSDYYGSFGKDKYKKEIEIKEMTLDTVKAIFDAELNVLGESRFGTGNLFGEGNGKKNKKQELLEKQYNEVSGVLKKINEKIQILRDISIPLSDRAKIDICFFDWSICFSEVMENGGFDIVIGNPPYIDSEHMTAIMPTMRELYAKKYQVAKGNWDIYVLFFELALKLVDNFGTLSFIVPNKVVSIDYAEALRVLLSKTTSAVFIRDFSRVKECFAASVYPCCLTFTKKERKNVFVAKMSSLENEEYSNMITKKQFFSLSNWNCWLGDGEEVNVMKSLITKTTSRIGDTFRVESAATVNEAYEVKKILLDEPKFSDKYFKLINSGTIDRYVSLWGVKKTQYIKDSYMNPVVERDVVKKVLPGRYEIACLPKLIVASMTKNLEVFHDSGDYIAGKSTTCVLHDSKDELNIVLGFLNSKLASFWLIRNYNTQAMSGEAINISKGIIEQLPYPPLTDKQREQISDIVKDICKMKQKDSSTATHSLEEKIDDIIFDAYELSPKERDLVKKNC